MDRPKHTVNPNAANLKVTVPRGWYLTIAAFSRESYNQVMTITDDFVPGESNTTYLGSPFNKPPTSMKNPRDLSDSLSIIAQPREISLDICFYYSKDRALSKQLAKVAVPSNLCNDINVHEVVKPDTAPTTIQDYVILMILVEDEKNEASVDRGVYDNIIATIHLFKRNPKQGAQDDDDDDDGDDDDDDGDNDEDDEDTTSILSRVNSPSIWS